MKPRIDRRRLRGSQAIQKYQKEEEEEDANEDSPLIIDQSQSQSQSQSQNGDSELEKRQGMTYYDKPRHHESPTMDTASEQEETPPHKEDASSSDDEEQTYNPDDEDYSNQSSTNDDDDDDDNYARLGYGKRRIAAPQRQTRRVQRRNTVDESDDEDDDDDNDDTDDDDFGTTLTSLSRGSKTPPKGWNSRRTPRSAKQKQISYAESSTSDENNDDDNDVRIARAAASSSEEELSPSFRTTSRRNQNRRPFSQRPAATRATRHCQPTAHVEKSIMSSDNGREEENDTGQQRLPRTMRPIRASANRAKQKLQASSLNDVASGSSDNNDETDASNSKRCRARRMPMLASSANDDGEEFVIANEDDDEEESYAIEDEDEDDDSLLQVTRKGNDRTNNIDDESFCSIDSSSSTTSAKQNGASSSRSPILDIRFQNNRKTQQRYTHASGRNSSSSDEEDISVSDLYTQPASPSSISRNNRRNNRNKLANDRGPVHARSNRCTCQSTEDALTMERLPEKAHVCFVTPDQITRQCFALETLHKVALTSSLTFYMDDVNSTNNTGNNDTDTNTSGRIHNTQQTFLQPPHFRSRMSDDLMDQIASRFGRAALDLHGDFYNRSNANKSNGDDDDDDDDDNRSLNGYQVDFDRILEDNASFQERLEQYINNLMGHSDMYCCPLCYTEAHRSLVLSDDHNELDTNEHINEQEEQDNPRDKYVNTQDPIAILGGLDNDEFKLASTFCFQKISQVKQHLREYHQVDLSILDGNDLFKRFKIRESDGLLQRFIDKLYKGSTTYQGAMMRYWNAGNTQMFIQLRELTKRHQLLMEHVKELSEEIDRDDQMEEEDTCLLQDTEVFLRSFHDRAIRVWEQVSSPYRKESKEELNDFIIPDGEEDDDEIDKTPRPFFDLPSSTRGVVKPTLEDTIIEQLQKRRRRRADLYSYSESDPSVLHSDDNDDGVQPGASANGESIKGDTEDYRTNNIPIRHHLDEEDDWMKQRRERPGRLKPNAPAFPKRNGPKEEDIVRNLKNTENAGSPKSSAPTSQNIASLNRAHRRIVESDDDE